MSGKGKGLNETGREAVGRACDLSISCMNRSMRFVDKRMDLQCGPEERSGARSAVQ